MKSIQCNIKNKWEESRFFHSYSFYRRLCHFQINVWWSKQPLHDLKASSVSESGHQRIAQRHSAIGWSDVRLHSWKRAKDRDIKTFSKHCCSCHRSAQFFHTKPPESWQGSSKRSRFSLLLALTSTTYWSTTKALWHDLRRNISPAVSFPEFNFSHCTSHTPVTLSKQKNSPCFYIFKGFHYCFCEWL